MKKININIITDKVLRIRLVQSEYRYKILKSILQNNNIIFLKKYYIQTIFNKFSSGKKKINRVNNTCLLTGSTHSVIHKTNFNRQQNKRFIFNNQYNSLKNFN